MRWRHTPLARPIWVVTRVGYHFHGAFRAISKTNHRIRALTWQCARQGRVRVSQNLRSSAWCRKTVVQIGRMDWRARQAASSSCPSSQDSAECHTEFASIALGFPTSWSARLACRGFDRKWADGRGGPCASRPEPRWLITCGGLRLSDQRPSLDVQGTKPQRPRSDPLTARHC
jgi:hypothetical protein